MSALLALIVMSGGCRSSADRAPRKARVAAVKANPKPTGTALRIDRGQLLSVIGIDNKDGEAAAAARRRYLGGAFPLARSFGLRASVSFRVQDTLAGDFKPEAVSLFLWPDQAAEDRLNNHPDWPALKALRPQAWDELRIYSTVVDEDVQFVLQPDKRYTIAAFWSDTGEQIGFERAMQRERESIVSNGGRVVLTMIEPRQESHASSKRAPRLVSIVEWEDDAAVARFVQNTGDGGGAFGPSTGVIRFELHRLTLRVR